MKKTERSPEFKKKVVLEALKGLRPLNEIASEFQIHPVQITKWKKHFLDAAETIFESPNKSKNKAKARGATEEQLHAKIGQLTVELDWLKKKVGI